MKLRLNAIATMLNIGHKMTPATAVLGGIVNQSLDRQDVQIEHKDVQSTTVKVMTDVASKMLAAGITVAPVKSAWLSKINWTQFAGPAASVAAIFGLGLTEGQIVAVVVGFQTIQSIVTWAIRTFWTTSITAGSLPASKLVGDQ